MKENLYRPTLRRRMRSRHRKRFEAPQAGILIQRDTSQFKRALTELGIEMIHATPYQPQGKGKIERIFRFMQDRLIKEMVTAKVKTMQEDNTFQLDGFTYQVSAGKDRISYARAKVEIRVYLSKIVKVFYKNREVGSFIYKTNKNNYLCNREDILAL